jgi:hypothetical protein
MISSCFMTSPALGSRRLLAHGPIYFGVAVAKTIGSEVVESHAITRCDPRRLVSAFWNCSPGSSVSQQFIPCFDRRHPRRCVVGVGTSAILLSGMEKVLLLFASPLIGLLAGYIFTNRYSSAMWATTHQLVLCAPS